MATASLKRTTPRAAGAGSTGRRAHATPFARKDLARRRLVALTRLMDEAVEVPVLGTRVGLDALLGLVPVVGDLISAAIGLYKKFGFKIEGTHEHYAFKDGRFADAYAMARLRPPLTSC